MPESTKNNKKAPPAGGKTLLRLKAAHKTVPKGTVFFFVCFD
ncbi:hypothetical protein [Butyricicoccus pullicaecorum]|nr:hypothetical protein [Butyricicoccus pullicaecorum]